MTHEGPDATEIAALRDLAARVGASIVASREDAEDIAQETMLRVNQHWTRVASYVRPWTVRVATNLAIAHVRRDKRTTRVLVDATDFDPHVELRIDLADAVAALPVRQRQAVVLRYLADHDEATVARLLGCSRGSVKRHLHRAVNTLRSSPRLDTTIETGATPMTTTNWTKHGFIAAAEPIDGWPARPWDHWFIQQEESRDRVAVDAHGQFILDADGDEVMSGPGFNHEAVKVLPRDEPDPPEQPDPRPLVPAALVEILDDALRYATYFGHPWVGDEHLGLALAARRLLPNTTEDALRAGVARFYEGPWADARLGIVRARNAGAPFEQQPEANFSWTWSLAQTIEHAAEPTLESLGTSLVNKEHSLVRILLAK